MSAETCLIVNADDFGLSPGTNAGIIAAHEQGIVTSTSLMVRQPAAQAAAEYARERPELGLGLHLDLGEWFYASGQWSARYEVVPLNDAHAVREEVLRQWDRFIALVGREPSHIDSHQHVHLEPAVKEAARQIADDHGVTLRHVSRSVRYCGDFYGQTARGEQLPAAISTERLLELIDALPPGVTELACHPGFDDTLDTMYRAERRAEVHALYDPRVRERIEERRIRLVNFAQLPRVSPRVAGATPQISTSAICCCLVIVLALLSSGVGCHRQEVEETPASLQQQVKDNDPDVRYTAVKSLGDLGAEAKPAIPVLVEALSDQSEEVRARAAYSLANIGEDAAAAIPQLIKGLHDDDPDVREASAYALPAMGPQAVTALPELRACAKDSDEDVRDAVDTAIKKLQLAVKFRDVKKQ